MRFNIAPALKAALLFVLCTIFASYVPAQNVRPTRITQPIDNTNLVTLQGNTHPLARPQYDQGRADDSLPMQRMQMVLQRGPQQETALRALLEQQQSNSSPSYHQWLTPQQVGEQFGPADQDIQTITSWLQAQGFQVNAVSNGKTIVEFDGTAGQIRQTFHTEIHKYVVNGEQHYANASDPQIPAALAPVVAGVNTLNNFPKKAQSRTVGIFKRENDNGKVTPQFSFSNCGNQPCNALGPTDFATIYNVLPLWNTSPAIDGTGQTIAIVGDSEICTGTTLPQGCASDDVKAFRTLFGLPTSNAFNEPQIILNGPDPGFSPDEKEGDLDVEWSGAVAKNAQILFVIAQNTEASSGIDLAAEHIVDNDLAPVMSESFGECELFLGNAANNFFSNLWEQAAAEGITVIISAGDSGSAACDSNDFEEAATFGAMVNGIASTPFDTALGGTDFDVAATNYQSTYWTPPPTATTAPGVSAKSYIPETTWNDSCAQNGVTGCSSFDTTSASITIVAGGGGQSNCNNGNLISFEDVSFTCNGGYLKPNFQSGPGVQQDGARDLPDLSLFAADGAVSGSFYIVC
jgi:subtilase family serine protease